MAAAMQRRVFFRNLSAALWEENEDDHGTFAGGRYITRHSLLQSLHVQGAGELQLPFSPDGFERILRVSEEAPYGHDLAMIVDSAVRRAWQVDASKVTFPESPYFLLNTVHQLANRAVRKLGLDGAALGLEVHLYKLLLYETNGHFVLHRDTEKERGMFATLILQLPTEGGFEGGALLVQQGGTTKT